MGPFDQKSSYYMFMFGFSPWENAKMPLDNC